MFKIVDTIKKFFAIPEKESYSHNNCKCGHENSVHALDEIWEDGSCRIFSCNCKEFDSYER